MKTILKYLRNTKDMFLVYGANPEAELQVDCYCDARFETDRDDTKSQTIYVFILNGGAVRSLKMVLRVEKKLVVIEQPISPAPPVHSKYLRSGMRFMMLIMRLLVLCSEGKPVGPYVIKMKNYVAQLERLGYVLPQDLNVGLILNGLTSNFVGFVATPQVMAIQGGRIQKANKKSLNAKGKAPDKGRHLPPLQRGGSLEKELSCFLAELIKKKKQVGTASSLDIFTIELFSFPNKSWVYDTGCGTHICNTKQDLRGERKMKQRALYLCMGNGVRAQVEATGSDELVLPNGLVIC
ncbi:hypothetical protein Tco_0617632 [Tanacetum coccineum]